MVRLLVRNDPYLRSSSNYQLKIQQDLAHALYGSLIETPKHPAVVELPKDAVEHGIAKLLLAESSVAEFWTSDYSSKSKIRNFQEPDFAFLQYIWGPGHLEDPELREVFGSERDSYGFALTPGRSFSREEEPKCLFYSVWTDAKGKGKILTSEELDSIENSQRIKIAIAERQSVRSCMSLERRLGREMRRKLHAHS